MYAVCVQWTARALCSTVSLLFDVLFIRLWREEKFCAVHCCTAAARPRLSTVEIIVWHSVLGSRTIIFDFTRSEAKYDHGRYWAIWGRGSGDQRVEKGTVDIGMLSCIVPYSHSVTTGTKFRWRNNRIRRDSNSQPSSGVILTRQLFHFFSFTSSKKCFFFLVPLITPLKESAKENSDAIFSEKNVIQCWLIYRCLTWMRNWNLLSYFSEFIFFFPLNEKFRSF